MKIMRCNINLYYLYVFLDKDKIPYYIGQTLYYKQRKQSHNSRVKNKKYTSFKYEKARLLIREGFPLKIKLLHKNLNKKQANTLESYYINKYKLANTLDKKITKKSYKHGLCYTQVYRAWVNMRARCNNPKNNEFDNYGKRGIKVCKSWDKSFLSFYKDIGEPPSKKHSLERINNNKGYSKLNCKWATMSQQARNTRRVKKLTYRGINKTLVEWSEELDISYTTLRKRLRDGWDVEKTFNTPLNQHLHLLTYKGKTQNLKKWAEELDINVKTLRDRVNKSKWGVVKALNTPVN